MPRHHEKVGFAGQRTPSRVKQRACHLVLVPAVLALGGCGFDDRELSVASGVASQEGYGGGKAGQEAKGAAPGDGQLRTTEGEAGGAGFPRSESSRQEGQEAVSEAIGVAAVGGDCSGTASACTNLNRLLGCSGGRYEELAVCSGVCQVEADGARCVGDCTPGARRCGSSGLPETCTDALRFESGAPCGDTSPVCLQGACVACEPGTRRCSAQGSPEACADDGSGFRPTTACPADTPVCLQGLQGTGNCGECEPGTARACVDAAGTCTEGVQSCGPDAVWGSCGPSPGSVPQACGCPQGTRDCGNNRCVPEGPAGCCAADDCASPCEACVSGRCQAVPPGDPGRCASGSLCQDNACTSPPTPARLESLSIPGEFPLTFTRATSAPRSWVVRNAGEAATGALRVTSTNPTEFVVSSSTGCLGQPLGGGLSCALSIAFSPSTPGRRTASLSIAAGNAATLQLDVAGSSLIRIGDDCISTPGAPGVRSDLCQTGVCTRWLVDGDGDGFGAPESMYGAPERLLCGDGTGTPPPAYEVPGCRAGNALALPYVPDTRGEDCCDSPYDSCGTRPSSQSASAAAKPNQSTQQVGFAFCGISPNGFETSDFNCDGVVESPPSPPGVPVAFHL